MKLPGCNGDMCLTLTNGDNFAPGSKKVIKCYMTIHNSFKQLKIIYFTCGALLECNDLPRTTGNYAAIILRNVNANMFCMLKLHWNTHREPILEVE